MEIAKRIVKLPHLIICCLLLIIFWLLYHHHPSCTPFINITRETHKYSGLSSLLKEASRDDKTVIVTMVDQEWAKPESLLDLFLESFRIEDKLKHLLNHLIVVALDDQALRYCLLVHLHCYLHQDYRRKSSESLNPDGLVAGWSKKSVIKEILELGYNIMFTEADVMWLKNPLMHCHPDHHISVACGTFSSSDHTTPENTGGFFYAKSSEKTLDLFKILNVERVIHPTTGNQSLCDIIVKRKDIIDEVDLDVTYLDDANYFGRLCKLNTQDRDKIVTVHASCCNDTKSKVHHLKLLLQDRKDMNPRWRVPSECRGISSL